MLSHNKYWGTELLAKDLNSLQDFIAPNFHASIDTETKKKERKDKEQNTPKLINNTTKKPILLQ